MLEQNANSNAASAVVEVVEPDDGSEHSAVSRDFVAVGKRDNQPHSDRVMRHAASEENAVARKIDYLAHVFDLSVSRVKRANVNRQRYLQALPAACIAPREVRVRVLPLFRGCRSVDSVYQWHVSTSLGASPESGYRTLVLLSSKLTTSPEKDPAVDQPEPVASNSPENALRRHS